MFSYFVWNGTDSRDMGIYLDAPAPIMRGKERITEAKVLGRAGTLTLTEGGDIYEPYTQQLILRSRGNAQRIAKWLSGEGYITFSGEPDKRQRARVVNQVQFKRVSYNLDWNEGTVQWLCQPLKELIFEPESAYTSGTSLCNLGDTDEYPYIKLTGAYGDITVTTDNGTLLIEDLPSNYGGCIIDSGARMLLSLDGETMLTNLTTGIFPKLSPGYSAITITGSHAGTATVGRRQRWL